MIAIGVLFALQHRLPPGWTSVGRLALRVETRAGVTLKHFGVDDSGRYLYAQSGDVFDTVTGRHHELTIYGRGWVPNEEMRLVLDKSLRFPDWLGCPLGAVCMERAGVFWVKSLGTTKYGFRPGTFAARINGPSVKLSKWKQSLIDRRINAAFLEPPAREVKLASGGHTMDLRVLCESSQIVLHGISSYGIPINNAVDSKHRKVYLASTNPRGLIELHWGSKPVSVQLPLPASFGPRWEPSFDSTVLADGSICCPEQISKKKARFPGMSSDFATAIVDGSHRAWSLWDGLIFYGASYNGRYVAYGWAQDTSARIARVGP